MNKEEELTSECERLRTALSEERRWWSLAESMGQYAVTSGQKEGRLRRIDAALAGTPAPRPPRDESGPQCPECCEPMQPTEAHRCHQCDVFTGDTQWLIDKARELEEAPAPDHAAFRALAYSWAKNETDYTYSHNWRDKCAFELLALCSPVTRSEPTRADFAIEMVTDRNERTRLQVRHLPTNMWLRYSCGPRQGHFLDAYGEDYMRQDLAEEAIAMVRQRGTSVEGGPLYRVATEDQPQPAWPPIASAECGHGTPGAAWNSEKCPQCVEAFHAFVAERRDPAPEAQRAQSELAWLEPGDDALLDFMCDVQDYVEGNNCNLQRTFRAFDPEPYVVAFRATPAPNIAAAVAALQRAKGYCPCHDDINIALAHLQGGAK